MAPRSTLYTLSSRYSSPLSSIVEKTAIAIFDNG
jgi:hypothetical protein